MHRPNPLNPNLMTAKERLSELYGILADGLLRMRIRDAEVFAHEEKYRLHFSLDQSGGANTPTRRTA